MTGDHLKAITEAALAAVYGSAENAGRYICATCYENGTYMEIAPVNATSDLFKIVVVGNNEMALWRCSMEDVPDTRSGETRRSMAVRHVLRSLLPFDQRPLPELIVTAGLIAAVARVSMGFPLDPEDSDAIKIDRDLKEAIGDAFLVTTLPGGCAAIIAHKGDCEKDMPTVRGALSSRMARIVMLDRIRLKGLWRSSVGLLPDWVRNDGGQWSTSSPQTYSGKIAGHNFNSGILAIDFAATAVQAAHVGIDRLLMERFAAALSSK